MVKYTFEEFLEKVKKLYGDKYVYTLEGFNKRLITGKIEYFCPKHGLITQLLSTHLKGCGCNQCGNEKIGDKKRLTYEKFIEKARNIHGEKYEYDWSNYESASKPIRIYCKSHNFWFEQLIGNHLKGCGCPKCGGNYKFSNEEYISYLKEKYPNTLINFDKIEYKNNHTPVTLTCPIHGDFELTPITLETNLECPECQKTRLHNKYSKTNEEFIKEAKLVHGNKYSYEKTEYNTSKKPVIITCPIHGDFKQKPVTHLKGCGCPKCGNEMIWNNRDRITTDKFIEKAKEIHGKKYDYSKTEYKDAHSKVSIICPKHGIFKQLPSAHLKGQGCPYCKFEKTHSKQERGLTDYLQKELNCKVLANSRKLLYPLELDIYIPSMNIAFEYDGLYWHSDAKIEKKYHLNKTEKCSEKGVQLYHIFEDEWLNKKDIVLSKIKSVIGKTENKIFARKCEIKEITSLELKEFLETNHLQGNVNSKYRYGLYYNDELVSVMSFGHLRKNLGHVGSKDDFELLRFCNKLNTIVVGGASKLLKHFIDEIKPKRIITYADRRWSNGNLYLKLGFTHTHNSQPNYFYTDGQKRENRFKYRKDILVKEGYDSNKSESEIMKERKFNKIYDCGSMVFEMNL